MIIDHIRNREKYYFLGENYRIALDYLAAVTEDVAGIKQDVVLKGEDVYVKVRPMMTKAAADAQYEAHARYADIHYLAGGRELIGYADVATMKPSEYNAEKDVMFLEGEGTMLPMTKGYFMITLADDAHKPAVGWTEEPEKILKLIAKVIL